MSIQCLQSYILTIWLYIFVLFIYFFFVLLLVYYLPYLEQNHVSHPKSSFSKFVENMLSIIFRECTTHKAFSTLWLFKCMSTSFFNFYFISWFVLNKFTITLWIAHVCQTCNSLFFLIQSFVWHLFLYHSLSLKIHLGYHHHFLLHFLYLI